MADDDRLLELLGRALDLGDVEPPGDRVAALRIQAAARQERQATTTPPPAESATDPQETGPTPPPSPVPLRPSPPTGPDDGRHGLRVGWVAAGVAVAAAAVVIALIAAPAVLKDRGGETSVASGRSAASHREAVSRLRAAMVSNDPLVVARAYADLLHVTRQLPPTERDRVGSDTVQAHVEAIQFLRRHPTPEVLAVVPDPPNGGGAPATISPGTAVPSPTTVAPPAGTRPTTPAPPPLPTMAPAVTPSVTIRAVTPTIDGTFAVEFTVSGFTPDRQRRPGTRAVRFSFDGGQAPEVWAGPSPWTLSADHAIRFQQVCAAVVDHRGIEEPGSGNCVNIL